MHIFYIPMCFVEHIYEKFKTYIKYSIRIKQVKDYSSKLTITKVLMYIISIRPKKEQTEEYTNIDFVFQKNEYINAIDKKLTTKNFLNSVLSYIFYIPLYLIKKIRDKYKDYTKTFISIE